MNKTGGVTTARPFYVRCRSYLFACRRFREHSAQARLPDEAKNSNENVDGIKHDQNAHSRVSADQYQRRREPHRQHTILGYESLTQIGKTP
jgi:hypothetical protein